MFATSCSFALLGLSFSMLLISCGSGAGGMKNSPQPPVFTSTPPTAAAQDTAYSYAISATDPAGGSVSFALTTGPSGAAVNAHALSWTPTAAQSRTSNSFTVTATTSEGGTAAQSWSVSPAGVVTVNWINTYWEPTGKVQSPVSPSAILGVSAVVPQPDGSLTVLKGSSVGGGVFTIANVPAGYYWLTFGTALTPLPLRSYWTSTSNFDAGADLAGGPVSSLGSSTKTTFDFQLSGLDAIASSTLVDFQTSAQLGLPYLPDSADSTTLSATFGDTSNIDWSQIRHAFLLQYEPSSLGSWNTMSMGAWTEVANLSLANGVTNTISQTLQPSQATAVDVHVPGSLWADMFNNASPATPSSYASGFSLVAEPFVTGIDAQGLGLLTLASTTFQSSGLGFSLQPFATCDPAGFLLFPENNRPAVLTDQDLGTLSYGDPFSSPWTHALTFCQEAVVPIALPSSTSTQNFALVAGIRVAPGSPLAPLVGPVQSPTINNGSLFTAATLNTGTVTLSWSAPASGIAIGYSVEVFAASTLNTGAVIYQPVGTYYTAKTSVTLPPLSGGNTYVFAITSLVNGAAKIETSPHRSALPAGFANVVSAPITISSGAAQTLIRGNGRLIQRMSHGASKEQPEK